MKAETLDHKMESIRQRLTELFQALRIFGAVEARYRSLVEASPDAIALTDLTANILMVNSQAAAMFGYGSVQEAIGQNAFGFIAAEDRPRAMKDLRKTLETGSVRDIEYTVLRKDGTPFSIELSTSLIVNAGGEPHAFIAVLRDVTRRKQAEEALRHSEERHRLVTRATNEVIWDWNMVTGEVVWNRALYTVFGYTQPEAGSNIEQAYTWWQDHIHPADQKKVITSFNAALATGGDIWSAEYRFRRADGSYATVLDRGYFARDGKGEPVRMIGAMLDLTERRRAEEALRRSEEHFRALIEKSFDVLFVLNGEGILSYISPSVEQLTGYTPAELIDRSGFEFVHPDDLPHVMNAFAHIVQNPGLAQSIEMRVQHKDGSWRFVEARGRNVLADPAVEGVVINVRDTTERKQAETALRATQKQLQHVLSSSPAVIYALAIEAETFRPTWVSDNIAQMMGYQAQETLSLDWWADHLHPDDRARVLSEQALPVPNDRLLREYRLRHKDGKYIWIRDEARLLRDAAGQPMEVIGSWSDITERKQAEMALRQSEERFSTTFHASPIAISLTTLPSEHFLDVNDSFLRLTGYSREEVIGHTPLELHLWVNREERARIGRLLAEGRSARSMETKFRRKSGEIVETLASFELVDLAGQRCVLTLAHDMTERKRAEEKIARYAAHLRALSHRLVEVQEAERRQLAQELHDRVGQNLTALSINLNIIRDQLALESTARIPTWLDDSQRLVERTVEHIRDVMAELRPPVLDDYGLVAALRWYARQFSKRAGVIMTVHGKEPIPRLPGSIETALFRIAQEALTNVAKHAQAERVTLTLALQPECIGLTIADDGVGFDPAAVQRPKEQPRWGLIHMQERAEAWGGRFRLDSAPGQGTRITIEVPR